MSMRVSKFYVHLHANSVSNGDEKKNESFYVR